MKTLFIEARKRSKDFDINVIKDIPGKIHLLYSIQYKGLAEEIKKQLENKVIAFEQVLGCSKIKPKATLLLIGSGRFHALNIAISTKNPVLIYENSKIHRISKEEILTFEKQTKIKIAKFLFSSSIGIIISTKPGQAKPGESIKKKLKEQFPDKNFYLFVSDNINTAEFENFPVEFWINTACPGLESDSNKILNYETILEIKK